jgi:predicted branched-subunit amino acid permease
METDAALIAAFSGLRDTIPLIVGTTPFAVIFGTVAVSSGLPPEMALALSARLKPKQSPRRSHICDIST